MLLHYTPLEEEIKKIAFSVYSPEMIRKFSKAKITVPDTYDDEGYPIEGGLMDPRLGVVDPGLKCKTCGGNYRTCPGHFGHIDLVKPVIHPHFARHIYYVLLNTCEHCHRVLDVPELRTKLSTKLRPKKCPHCGKELGEIKWERPTSFLYNGKELFPDKVREWLSSIPDEEVKKLGFDPLVVRPEWFVLTAILVPPVRVRPSITLESGEKSEDDLTHKLVEIIRVNQKLESNINAGAPQLIIEDLWALLQYHVSTYFDNELPNIPPARHRSGRPLKTIAQRLKGKEGRFRYNLIGKRVNFSARTVISPDPIISINEVGVPQLIAEELTVPIPVTEWNIEELKEYIRRTKYPRALYVIRKDGMRVKVTDASRERILQQIGVGWVVERQLIDGDVVLFNRQPSLHRISMMAHYVRVLSGKTFRINPIVCPPYNADFDGDEMNLHVLQTEEARAEAIELMDVEKQILSPRHGRPIIKPNEDGITAIYLLSADETEVDKQTAARLLFLAGITELPKPDRGNNYSGKLLFSMLLPSDFNLKVETKNGILEIKNGKLVKGTFDKKSIDEFLKAFFIKYGPTKTRHMMDGLHKMAIELLTLNGWSVSYKNYYISEKAKREIKAILERMDREIANLIAKYKNKTLERAPGMSLKQTLESLIMAATREAREKCGEILKKDLGEENTSIIMAKIGSRGSLLNVIQMSGFVGQQAIRNKRPYRGYYHRILPFFERDVIKGRERGFVYSCFTSGLDVDEFWMHAMAGRESIVNTAIRTSRSGYMYRRMCNAMQDFVVDDDFTVRDARGQIVQFIYGGDARDPMYSQVDVYVKNKDLLRIAPGEAVGVVAAQSLGEPGTQMTMRTFHYAGVAEHVPTGLPRIIEIVDAKSRPKKSMIEIRFKKDVSKDRKKVEEFARKIEAIKIGDIAKLYPIVEKRLIMIKLDESALKAYRLSKKDIMEKIKKKLMELKKKEIVTSMKSKGAVIAVKFKKTKKTATMIARYYLKMRNMLINGVEGITKTVVLHDGNEYFIQASGDNLAGLIKFKEVDLRRCYTNNIMMIYEMFGVEAARNAIVREIKTTLDMQGLDVDVRHIMLLADGMTASGKIMGVGRHGLAGSKVSVLARAAFEETIKHITNAAANGEVDPLTGVVENVIAGKILPIGTGRILLKYVRKSK